ncbi:peptide-methionine (S)-S-oxide reductase MsrA [Acetobacteraceae bacterium]|nr:peptide-methionine (S)-S-oxide reductase MsrA [Candidatus Parcubacteria bacterium]
MDTETIVLGGGCFWCTEAVFKMLKGVRTVEPGYAGGGSENPTYEEVSTGTSGHVEVIKVEYEPEELAFEEILRVFFVSHDATQLDRQGSDVGPQYASVIFYTTEHQREKSQHYIDVLNKSAESADAKPIVTRVEPLLKFNFAENYHKDYFENHKGAQYCELVIEPKVEKVQQKFAHLLKKE